MNVQHTVNTNQLRNELTELTHRIAGGELIAIERYNTPIAILVPVSWVKDRQRLDDLELDSHYEKLQAVYGNRSRIELAIEAVKQYGYANETNGKSAKLDHILSQVQDASTAQIAELLTQIISLLGGSNDETHTNESTGGQ